MNEAGFVEDTIAAVDGRTIHTYHGEGAGGGHAPDLLRITGERNVLPSSTNCTRPFGVNTVDETTDMIITVHHLNPKLPEDVAFASSRVRTESMAAEDVLHDRGVISMYSSDSQAMGRVGENWVRLMQTADKMKNLTGPLPGDDGSDNLRVLRYIAKLTINPAITHGMAYAIVSGVREARGHGAVETSLLWRKTPDDYQRRHDQLVCHGRPKCLGANS